MNENKSDIHNYNLQPFKINVLDKEQALLEKLVSLIRFSFDSDPVESIKGKIRHFYDLYYFMNDDDCISFINSEEFRSKLVDLLAHDREIFDEPIGWKEKSLKDSPLVNDFDNIWTQLKTTYTTELSALAYSQIPDETDIAKSFKEILLLTQKNSA